MLVVGFMNLHNRLNLVEALISTSEAVLPSILPAVRSAMFFSSSHLQVCPSSRRCDSERFFMEAWRRHAVC